MKQHPLRSFLLTVFRPLFWLIFPYRVRGIENLKALDGKGALICCNHISVLDPVFVLMGQRRPVFYMTKAELFQKKFNAWILGKVMGAFPVERGKGDMTAVNYAFDVVNNGELLGIFPQGTCVRTRDLGRPKSGAALIAARTGATVIPACLVTKDFHVRAFRRTTLVFGKPLTSEELQVVNEEHPKLRHASRVIMESIDALIEQEWNGN